MHFLEIAAFLLTGFLLGLKHSLDSDHLIAVSTMVTNNQKARTSAWQGALWGFGHTTTLFVVGFLVLFFKLNLPQKLTNFFEMAVGFILVYLGLSLFAKLRKNRIHFHIHKHDDQRHVHFHSHKESVEHNHGHRPYFVGLAHGLAGSATLMLIVLSSVESAILGLIFILIFGIGSVVGMAAFGLIASIPLKLSSERFSNLNHSLKFLVASASTAIGLSIILHAI